MKCFYVTRKSHNYTVYRMYRTLSDIREEYNILDRTSYNATQVHLAVHHGHILTLNSPVLTATSHLSLT